MAHWCKLFRQQELVRFNSDHIFTSGAGQIHTLLGTNISLSKAVLKMSFLFPRWDMLIPWRVMQHTSNTQKTSPHCVRLKYITRDFSSFGSDELGIRTLMYRLFFFKGPRFLYQLCAPKHGDVIMKNKKPCWQVTLNFRSSSSNCNI